MNQDSIYRYLGLMTISLFVIFIVFKSMSFQAKIVEGLTSDRRKKSSSSSASSAQETSIENTADAIKSATNQTEDSLNITKYRKNYEDILIELESFVDTAMFDAIVSTSTQIMAGGAGAQQVIADINAYSSFKASLNEAMTFLDKTPSLGGGAKSISSRF
jgi:hypothetical protein